MILESSPRVNFIVGTGFDGWCDYPDGGYLVYPYAVLKEFGTLTQTLSALWAMSCGRSPVWTPAPLAQVGCLPAKTLKDHLRSLKSRDVLRVWKDGRDTQYALNASSTAYAHYRLETSYVRIPRVWRHYWPDLGFADLLLLGFYRFTCGETWEEQRACRMSYAEIAGVLGFSGRTWRRAANALECRGLIVRTGESGRAVTVRLPEPATCSYMNPGHFQPHPGQSQPVAA